MIVSDIVEFDKKRVKVFIDGDFAFVLYKGELRDYNIKSDNYVSDNIYKEIVEVLLPKRATKRAMNLLQKRDYTEKQLREKIAEGLYSEEAINSAIEYVKSYHYLDDDRYARDYINYHLSTRSRNRIVQDLMNKGINKEMIQGIFDEMIGDPDNGDIYDIEREQIEKLLEKKHYNSEMDYKEKQKIMAFLLRKGYVIESVKSAMESFKG